MNVGDRVEVLDPYLAQMREIMRSAGIEPEPNHLGVIDEIHDQTAYVLFDDGMLAPYSLHEMRVI